MRRRKKRIAIASAAAYGWNYVSISLPWHRRSARQAGPKQHALAPVRPPGPPRTSAVGEDERIHFTYQPFLEPGSLPAPGPVFIHARECARYDAPELPPDFRSLPLVFEAYRAGGELLARERVGTRASEEALAALFERSAADYVHIRNGEAGCSFATNNSGLLAQGVN